MSLTSNLLRSISTIALLSLLSAALVCNSGCNVGQRGNMIGQQAYGQGNLTQAVTHFQQVVAQNPRDANSNYNLAASYFELGRQQRNMQYMNQAEQYYRQAIASNDQHTAAHRGLAATLIETGREKFAFDLLKEWKNRYPNQADPMIELARLYQEYGDNSHATDMLADALRVDGRNVRALKAMGMVRESQGQTELALDNYYRVLQLDNRQVDVAQRVTQLQTQLAQNSNQSGTVPRYGSTQPYQSR
jgi:tetratricopeptide (TPR) repeat protein